MHSDRGKCKNTAIHLNIQGQWITFWQSKLYHSAYTCVTHVITKVNQGVPSGSGNKKQVINWLSCSILYHFLSKHKMCFRSAIYPHLMLWTNNPKEEGNESECSSTMLFIITSPRPFGSVCINKKTSPPSGKSRKLKEYKTLRNTALHNPLLYVHCSIYYLC